jgi:hypothetical protein
LASPSYPSPKERDDTSMFLQTSQIRSTSFFSAFLASPSYPSPKERDDTSMFLQTSQIRSTPFFSAFLASPSYSSPCFSAFQRDRNEGERDDTTVFGQTLQVPYQPHHPSLKILVQSFRMFPIQNSTLDIQNNWSKP